MKYIGVLLLAVFAFILSGCASSDIQVKDSGTFAKCLTENKVVMYGAFWCPHCQNQKEMFGSGWENINYIECSLPDRSGQTQICKDAVVRAYPTWEFANGKRIEGELTFLQLSQLSGCSVSGN